MGEAGSGREALQLLDRCRPEVLMMDIGLPGMDGVLTTREARRRAPDTRILIVTAHTDLPNVMDALDAGAAGFALKTDGAEALIEALARLQAGAQYLAPSLAGRLQAARVRRQQQSDLLAVLVPARAGDLPTGRTVPEGARDRQRAVHRPEDGGHAPQSHLPQAVVTKHGGAGSAGGQSGHGGQRQDAVSVLADAI